MKRIAFVRIAQETNGLSPVLTEVESFERTHFLSGQALLDCCARWQTEAKGFLRNAELSGFVRAARTFPDVEIVPLFSAWAVPGGPLSASAFAWFRAHLVAALEAAGPLDGLFFSMHGAMTAEDHNEPEAVFLADARSVIGEVPIAVSLDLHAHLTPEKVRLGTILAAYRTNPHRDHHTVGHRAGEILVRTVLGEVKPVAGWRSLPMVLGGGTTIDFFPTMRPVFRRMKQMEKDPKVLYVSLLMCHLWVDHPENGWATHVVTDNDPELAEKLADELAKLSWAVRHKLPPEFPGPEAAIQQARSVWIRRSLGTVCISDASDMVGAGATGESTHLLKALIDTAADMASLTTIRDDAVVAELWDRPTGDSVDVTLGGKLLSEALSPPLQLSARIRSQHPDTPFGDVVVLDAGHVQVVVTSAPPLAMKPSFYSDVGLSPFAADICVVKSLFPFRLFFLFHNRMTIYTKSRGITDFDAGLQIDFARPIHPKDPVDGWRPTDAERRG